MPTCLTASSAIRSSCRPRASTCSPVRRGRRSGLRRRHDGQLNERSAPARHGSSGEPWLTSERVLIAHAHTVPRSSASEPCLCRTSDHPCGVWRLASSTDGPRAGRTSATGRAPLASTGCWFRPFRQPRVLGRQCCLLTPSASAAVVASCSLSQRVRGGGVSISGVIVRDATCRLPGHLCTSAVPNRPPTAGPSTASRSLTIDRTRIPRQRGRSRSTHQPAAAARRDKRSEPPRP